MTPPKIVVYGDAGIPAAHFGEFLQQHIEVSPIPDTYPADRLEYLAPFQAVILNNTADPEGTLERVRLLRKSFTNLPIILAADNPSISYLVRAYRNGLTDCLLSPVSREQLTDVLSNYVDARTPQSDGYSLGLLPEAFRRSVTWKPAADDIDLFVQFLGTLKISRKGKRIDLPSGHRQRSLLAFLLFHAKSPVHRDRVINHFWPDHDHDCAKNNLNVGICNLRRHLDKHFKEDVILFQNEYFYINPELRVRRDLDDFMHQFHEGKNAESRQLEQEAASFYGSAVQMGNEFLEEFLQEDWTARGREEFTEKYLYALDFLSSFRQKKQQFESALDAMRLMLYKDDCLESVHGKIMACYLAMGKKEKAVRQFQECTRILWEKLDMKPSAEIQALLEDVKRPKS